jgi:MoaA/NifB/PqqE/SkfB family radical SAM enzyme
VVATTEAPSYRRFALEKLRAEGMTGDQIKSAGVTRSLGIRDWHGSVFVSSTGEICPAGFLPVVAGNVRKNHRVDIYRSSSLHDPTRFAGRCGHCEYHALCGGSRSRTYAAT